VPVASSNCQASIGLRAEDAALTLVQHSSAEVAGMVSTHSVSYLVRVWVIGGSEGWGSGYRSEASVWEG